MDYAKTNDIQEIVEADRKNVWHHLIQHKPFESQIDPRIIVEGKGMRVWDQHGKEHLDAVSGGVWTVNVGYGRERIADAVRDQLVKMNYFAGSAGSIPGAIFSDMLLDKMPGLSRVYYSNSGSEANEKVYKMVRQISHKHHNGKKFKILYRERDYHGTTITNLAAGGQEERNAQYGPYTPGFVEIPHCLEYHSQYGEGDYTKQSLDAIEAVILREGADTIGSLVLEPVTAGGGVITPPEGYWDGVQALCKKYEILLHIDEVVCGLGRTGTWFACESMGIVPDTITVAKAVTSGYQPLSAVLVGDRIARTLESHGEYYHGYTYSGHPVGCAVALANIDIIEREGLVERVRDDTGPYLVARLKEVIGDHPLVGEVRGFGLLAGIEIVKNRETRERFEPAGSAAVVIRDHSIANGMMMRAVGDTMILSPPLTWTRETIDEAAGIFKLALDKAMEELG